MIDHEYRITSKEIPASSQDAGYFVAELSQVYVSVKGKRTGADYSEKLFFGTTQIAAVLQANEAFQNWLKLYEQKALISSQSASSEL